MHEAEIVRRACLLARGVLAADDACDGMTDVETGRLMLFAAYEPARLGQLYSSAQRRARRLLLSLLAPAQAEELYRRQNVVITGSLGGLYRLTPRGNGCVERVVRRNGRHYVRQSFCYHEAAETASLPAADVAIMHLLVLTTDEGRFLAEAHARPSQLWDGEWRRTLNRARHAAAEEVTA